MLKDEGNKEPINILYIIAGKGRCKWYKLCLLLSYKPIDYVLWIIYR